MMKIETKILINANPGTVWRVLTNFENHPAWNPFIRSIKGEKVVGSNISVFLKPPDGKGMSFKPEILKFEPEKEFRWKGKLGIKGIFDGEHYFILEKISENQTSFTHGEEFTGILVWMMGNVLKKTRDGFDLMNKALKKECENDSSPRSSTE
jgi:hypothetical protein